MRLLIVSFMDDKTKRIMRLANTAWFELIKYSTFSLYFTTADSLPQITDRLSKYCRPISVNFKKSKISKMKALVPYLTKLTNMTELSYPSMDTVLTLDEWLSLTALSNLESWEVPYSCPHQLLAHLHNLTKFRFEGAHPLEPLRKDLHKFTKLVSISFAGDPDLDSLSANLTELGILASTDSRGMTKLTRLKKLIHVTTHNGPKGNFPVHLLTTLDNLGVAHQRELIAEFPRNLTALTFRGGELTAEQSGPIEQLERLKTLAVDSVRVNHFEFLTALTALEALSLWRTTGAYLGNLRSETLTSLVMTVPRMMPSLEHLSRLASLEDLYLEEQFTRDHRQLPLMVDYKGMRSLTRLTRLEAVLSIGHPSLLCVTELTSLQTLQIRSSSDGPRVVLDANWNFLRLTNLQHLWLDVECAAGTIRSLSGFTNLCYLEGDFAVNDFSFLKAMEKLTALKMGPYGNQNSLWTTLSKLTGLETLVLSCVKSGEDIMGLTSLQKLTHLGLLHSSQSICEHLTLLTTVQLLTVDYLAAKEYWQEKEEELQKKMPYLFKLIVQ